LGGAIATRTGVIAAGSTTAGVAATVCTTTTTTVAVTTRATVTVTTLATGATVVTTSTGVATWVGELLVGREVWLAEHLTTHYPHLDANFAIHGLSFRQSIIDVSAQRVQRRTTFFVLLGTGNFSTAETATALNLDAFGTNTHSSLNRHFHGATEGDTSGQLLSDALAYQLGIQLRTLDFEDVDLNVFAGDLLQLVLNLVNFLAAFANYHTRTSRVDSDGDAL
jgi:hypothetical protein